MLHVHGELFSFMEMLMLFGYPNIKQFLRPSNNSCKLTIYKWSLLQNPYKFYWRFTCFCRNKGETARKHSFRFTIFYWVPLVYCRVCNAYAFFWLNRWHFLEIAADWSRTRIWTTVWRAVLSSLHFQQLLLSILLWQSSFWSFLMNDDTSSWYRVKSVTLYGLVGSDHVTPFKSG